LGPGVTFIRAVIQSIDPVAKRVETDAGTHESDVFVVALGADLGPTAAPPRAKAVASSTRWKRRSRRVR
jgi:sulfide:quinone oxidoreductase